MKRKSILSLVLSGILAISLIGCGGRTYVSNDDKTIKIGVSPVPHKEIVEQAVEIHIIHQRYSDHCRQS